MDIAIILLTILGYWIGMGFCVAAIMFLFYKFAVVLGDICEFVRK